MAKKRMAWETAHYLGVVAAPETEDIYLLGVGIKSLNRSPSPKTTTDAYINEKNGSPTITGYDNSFALNYDDIVDDDAVKALQRVADDQLTGTDAEFYYYRVDLLARLKQAPIPRGAIALRASRRRDQRGRERCDWQAAPCARSATLKKARSTRPPRRLLPIRRHDRRRRAMCSCCMARRL